MDPLHRFMTGKMPNEDALARKIMWLTIAGSVVLLAMHFLLPS